MGKVTGSRAGDLLAKGRGSEESVKRRDLRLALVLERITGQPEDEGFVSADMKRGAELEPDAVLAYEAATGSIVRRYGFLQHPEMPCVGYSPDGIVGDFKGVVEIKVPKQATHMRYLRDKVLPADYVGQVVHGLLVTGAEFCDFVSFDPRFPRPLQLFTVRVERDEKAIRAYKLALEMFLSEVDKELAEVRGMVEKAA